MKNVKKIFWALVLMLAMVSSVLAIPVPLGSSGDVKAEPVMSADSQITAIQYTFTYTETQDMWHEHIVMYCPDPGKVGCSRKASILPTSTQGMTRVWDVPIAIIKRGQNATNWANDNSWNSQDLWLGLPDCKLKLGKNLIYYNSVKDDTIPNSGGMHVLYIGPGAIFVPAADDENIFRCGEKKVAKAAVVSKAPAATTIAPAKADQSMGGGDSKADVKGNNNDVTPQTVKQQAKQKTKVKIKGNNNRVDIKKTINQTGVNAKTSGANSPITIHIGGVPTTSDETCTQCHKNVIKSTTDSSGNVTTEQKQVEQLKQDDVKSNNIPKAKPKKEKQQFGPLTEYFRSK